MATPPIFHRSHSTIKEFDDPHWTVCPHRPEMRQEGTPNRGTLMVMQSYADFTRCVPFNPLEPSLDHLFMFTQHFLQQCIYDKVIDRVRTHLKEAGQTPCPLDLGYGQMNLNSLQVTKIPSPNQPQYFTEKSERDMGCLVKINSEVLHRAGITYSNIISLTSSVFQHPKKECAMVLDNLAKLVQMKLQWAYNIDIHQNRGACGTSHLPGRRLLPISDVPACQPTSPPEHKRKSRFESKTEIKCKEECEPKAELDCDQVCEPKPTERVIPMTDLQRAWDVVLQRLGVQTGDSSEDLSEVFAEESAEGAAASRQVVSTSQQVQTHLLLVALLDHVSDIYGTDETQRYQLYKVLVKTLVSPSGLQGFGSLDEASSLRTQYKLAFSKFLESALATIQQKKFPIGTIQDRARRFFEPRFDARRPLGVPSISTIITHNTSRYKRDFRQIQRVGAGAYGSVYKVKNKLDSREYAIKKISFESSEPDLWLKIINEVKVLAQLSHKHVVRYHNAWIEYENPALIALAETPGEIPLPRLTAPEPVPALTYEHQNNALTGNDAQEVKEEDPDDSIVFVETSVTENESHKQAEPVSSYGHSSSSTSSSDSSSSMAGPHSSPSSDGLERVNGRLPSAVVVLNIQMELCTHTLKDWIQRRNQKLSDTHADKYNLIDASINQQLLRQILKAISFIHSQNLMHRDIKPKNIFLVPSETGGCCDVVKVGDFGLARHTNAEEEPLTPHPGEPSNAGSFTCGVGTTIYAAPEQLSGSSYTMKCDMYSIGMVIFEMYHPFMTEMERVKTLGNLRKNIIPEEFMNYWSEQVRYIEALLGDDCSLRPSADELLQSELFNRRISVESCLKRENMELRRLLAKKDADNAMKDAEIAKRDAEIAFLRRALVNTAISPKKQNPRTSPS